MDTRFYTVLDGEEKTIDEFNPWVYGWKENPFLDQYGVPVRVELSDVVTFIDKLDLNDYRRYRFLTLYTILTCTKEKVYAITF